MRLFKLYYFNLLDITPKLTESFNVVTTTKEEEYFVVYIKHPGISKVSFLLNLDRLNIPLPFFILGLETTNRTKSTSFTTITTTNKNKLNKRIKYLNSCNKTSY